MTAPTLPRGVYGRLSPRRAHFLAECNTIAAADLAGEVDNEGKVRTWRGPYAGLDNDARAAGARMLERQHERCAFRA